MLEIGFALRPQIHNDVEKCAPRAAHELGFGRRRELEMHAPYGSLEPIAGDAGLDDAGLQTARFEFLATKATREETSRIFPSFQLDDERALEPGLGEDHVRL